MIPPVNLLQMSLQILYLWLVRLVKRCVGFNIKQQWSNAGRVELILVMFSLNMKGNVSP